MDGVATHQPRLTGRQQAELAALTAALARARRGAPDEFVRVLFRLRAAGERLGVGVVELERSVMDGFGRRWA
jgi:hypothetical protein